VRILETGGFNELVTEVYLLQGRNFAELQMVDQAEGKATVQYVPSSYL
jgi:hypothetical protein